MFQSPTHPVGDREPYPYHLHSQSGLQTPQRPTMSHSTQSPLSATLSNDPLSILARTPLNQRTPAAATPVAGPTPTYTLPTTTNTNTTMPVSLTTPAARVSATTATSPPATSPQPAYKVRLRHLLQHSPTNNNTPTSPPHPPPPPQGMLAGPPPYDTPLLSATTPTASDRQVGKWEHPDLPFLNHLRRNHSITATSFRRLQINGAIVAALWLLTRTSPYQTVRWVVTEEVGFSSFLWGTAEFVVLLVPLFNFLETLWRFVKPGYAYSELGLTAAQRQLLGLDPRVSAAANSPPPVRAPKYQRRLFEEEVGHNPKLSDPTSPALAVDPTTPASPTANVNVNATATNQTMASPSPRRPPNHASPTPAAALRFRPITSRRALDNMLLPDGSSPNDTSDPFGPTSTPKTSAHPGTGDHRRTSLFGTMTTPTPTRTSNSNSNNNNTNTPATPHLTTPYRNRTPPGSRYSSTTQPYAMLPVYQTATPHSPPFFKDNRKKSKHGTITSQWSDRYTFSDTTTLLRDDLRLTDSAIDRLVENMRRWISTQILEPLVYSIDAVDAELEDRNWCHLTCANYDSLHNAAEALTAAATVASANVGSGIGSGNTGNTMGFASAPASGFGLSAPGSSFLGGGFGSGGTTTGPTGFGTSSASTAPSFGGLASRLGPTNANPDPPTTTTMGGFGGFGSSLGQSIPTNNQPQTPQNLADLSQTYAQDPLSKIRLKLEVYLALPNCPSRAYLLNRIRALARGGVLGAYRWDSGIRDWFTTGRLGFGGSGNEGSGLLGSGGVGGSSGINSNIGSGGSGLGSHNTSEFDANPTDTQILFHLVCTYLDLITPGASLEANGGRPFSFRHILHCDATPSTDPCETEAPLVIKQETLVPPYFVLLINPARPGRPAFTCIEESAGRPHRDHLFQILGGFFLLARREFSGYLGLLHVDAHHFGMDLILSGLNAEALEIDHNPLT